MHGFDIIPNESMVSSSLHSDSLHLNVGGVEKCAGHLILLAGSML